MSESPLTDEQMVKEALENKEAFSHIIERYEERLRRYLRRITNVNDADIDDLLQDTFIKIYQHLNDFDASFPFSSWVYRIARNTAISDHRRRAARPEALIVDSDDVAFQIADETDIERDAIDGEFSIALGSAIPRLRDDYREVLILRFFEEKSYDEISDIMMKPPGTIATLISRAKKELKQTLVEQENTTSAS